MKKQTKNTRQIAKRHKLPGIKSLNPIFASDFFYWPFYHARLTLLPVISVVGIFVTF